MPNVGSLQTEVIKANHNLPWASHYQVRSTLNLVTRKYFWLGMCQDVIQYIKDCAMCTQTKLIEYKPWGTAQSLPTPQEP